MLDVCQSKTCYVAKLVCLWDDKQHRAHDILHIAVESPRGQSIGVYEPKGRIQTFVIQLDRHYVNVLGCLSALVPCPTTSHTNVLLVPHLVFVHPVTLHRQSLYWHDHNEETILVQRY